MTNSIKQAVAYEHAHPKRLYPDGHLGTWDQWCLSKVYRDMFNGTAGPASRPTARLAYEATKAMGQIFGTDYRKAPRGAVHYWGGAGTAGHIAWDENGGGTKVRMASRNVKHLTGDAVGYTDIASYNAKTGLQYNGWGTFLGYTFADAPVDPKKIAAAKTAAAKKAAAAKAKAAAAAKKAAALKAKAEAAAKAAKAAAEKKAREDAEKAAIKAAAESLKLNIPLNSIPPTFYFKGADKPEIYEFQHGGSRHISPEEWADVTRFFGATRIVVSQALANQLIENR